MAGSKEEFEKIYRRYFNDVFLFSDIVIGIIVVESMLWKIKKVPISLGVLQ